MDRPDDEEAAPSPDDPAGGAEFSANVGVAGGSSTSIPSIRRIEVSGRTGVSGASSTFIPSILKENSTDGAAACDGRDGAGVFGSSARSALRGEELPADDEELSICRLIPALSSRSRRNDSPESETASTAPSSADASRGGSSTSVPPGSTGMPAESRARRCDASGGFRFDGSLDSAADGRALHAGHDQSRASASASAYVRNPAQRAWE